MRSPTILAAVAALLVTAGCGGEQSGNGTAASSAPVEAVAPPPGGDWAQMVRQTAEGGYVMGNPNADVKLIEFASMTCPACANFAETGMQPLIDKYVKTGRVAFELRNFVRDPLDITMSLVARCAGPERFFPITDAMFKSQRTFFDRMQSSQDRLQALQQLPPAQQFAGFAEVTGLQQWAAQRGIPSARQQQCLTDQGEIDRLVQMNSDATATYNVPGTPAFVLNGKLVEEAGGWQGLEPKIREALGS